MKVVLRPVAPNRVDGPSALSDALADAPDLAEIREGLTPGVRRGFAHRVASAKRPDTVARRVAGVVEALESDDPTPYRRR